jgi:FkbM family methyltransferase
MTARHLSLGYQNPRNPITMSKPDLAALMLKMESIDKKIDALLSQVNEVRQLVGPFAATFPDGSLLTQTIHNVKYFIDPDDLVIAPQMVIYRQWEADLSQIFYHLCDEDSVFVDVGANFGYFSILAANLISNRRSGRVFAFEPNPKLAALLRRNIEVNWSIAPVMLAEAAVTDVVGEVTLHVPVAHGANASLTASPDHDCTPVIVPAIRLDDAIPADTSVDIIKIDVEGHELSVLRGARAVIARSPKLHLIMEWSRKQMAEAGIDPAAVIAELEGFTPHRIELGSQPLAYPETFDWLLAQDYADVLFVRR